MCIRIYIHIDLVGRVFANGPGGLGLIPGWVKRKSLKMVLGTSLLNTQQYKVRIKGKVEQSSTIFYSLWYDATWDWIQVSRYFGEHSAY